MTAIKNLKCIQSEPVYTDVPYYTVGKVYKMSEGCHCKGDNGDGWYLKEAAGNTWQYAGDPEAGLFVECDEHGNEYRESEDSYISTPEEEEYLESLTGDADKWDSGELGADEEFVKVSDHTHGFKEISCNLKEISCNMAIAMDIQRLQKFLQNLDTDIELVIHKDFIAVNDDDCAEYRPAEGGVGTLIEYMQARGDVQKIKQKLDRR